MIICFIKFIIHNTTKGISLILEDVVTSFQKLLCKIFAAVSGQGVLLNNRIAAEIKKQLSVPWTPSYCKKRNVCEIDSSNWFFQVGTKASFCRFFKVSGFELTYSDLGTTIHFSFFTTQFFPPCLKITIPKYNEKKERVFSLTEK